MKYLLNQMLMPGSTVENFVDTMMTLRDEIGEQPVNIAQMRMMEHQMLPFMRDPSGACADLFNYIATAPRELCAQASEYIKTLGHDSQFLDKTTDLAMHVARLGEALDEFTKTLVKRAPWRYAYSDTVEVTRVWRTKEDQIAGTPATRKVQKASLPTRLVGLVTAEHEDGRKQTMLSMSSAHYKGDAGEIPCREDFLVDIPECFVIGFGASTKDRPRNINNETAMIGLYGVICDALPLISGCVGIAEKLAERGALSDPEGIYKGFVGTVRKTLNPEDSPNALIEIGGWA
jgi:hypothetical protein